MPRGMRQRAFLDADQIDEAKFQALGRMQRHQAHRVAGVVAIGVRQQRELRGEIAAPDAVFLHRAKPADQFVEILRRRCARAGSLTCSRRCSA